VCESSKNGVYTASTAWGTSLAVQTCCHCCPLFWTVELQPIDLTPAPATVDSAVTPPELEGLPDAHSDTATIAILENVISVSKGFLSDGTPLSLGTVHSLHMVEAHLSAVVCSACSLESLLPDKEQIAPNQHS
jgi:hypothetical protein